MSTSYLEKILNTSVVRPDFEPYIKLESDAYIDIIEKYFIPNAVNEYKRGWIDSGQNKYNWSVDAATKTLKIDFRINVYKFVISIDSKVYNITSDVCSAIVLYFSKNDGVQARVTFEHHPQQMYVVHIELPAAILF